MKANDSPLVGRSNGFEGRHHAEFDRSPAYRVQPERSGLPRRVSRWRSQSLPRLRPDALDHRPPFGRMRLLLDRTAAEGSADERPCADAGVLERYPAELRRPCRLTALRISQFRFRGA